MGIKRIGEEALRSKGRGLMLLMVLQLIHEHARGRVRELLWRLVPKVKAMGLFVVSAPNPAINRVVDNPYIP